MIMTITITDKITFNAKPEQLFEALTGSEKFGLVTGAPTEIDATAGGAFSLFGGMIQGRMIEVVPNERIVQAWRAGNWDAGVYSLVKFELHQDGEDTLLVFEHVGFPEGQAEHLKTGWQENYWTPLRKYLEQ